MGLSNYIFAGLFSALYFFGSSKNASKVIVPGYLIYLLFVVPLPGSHYYHVAALLNLVIGCILFKKYPIVALLYFLLIPVNSVGFIMYEYYYDPAIYNNLSLSIILMQIIILMLGNLLNGVDIRSGKLGALFCKGRALLLIIINNSYKLHRIMQKKKTKG